MQLRTKYKLAITMAKAPPVEVLLDEIQAWLEDLFKDDVTVDLISWEAVSELEERRTETEE